MADLNVEKPQAVDETTRRRAVKELHEKRAKERAEEIQALKAQYVQIKDSPALADIVAKAKQFAGYHLKLAKDGVGARKVGTDDKNQPIMEDYYLTQEQRVAELDQAKGIEQLISYIEQKIN